MWDYFGPESDALPYRVLEVQTFPLNAEFCYFEESNINSLKMYVNSILPLYVFLYF